MLRLLTAPIVPRANRRVTEAWFCGRLVRKGSDRQSRSRPVPNCHIANHSAKVEGDRNRSTISLATTEWAAISSLPWSGASPAERRHALQAPGFAQPTAAAHTDAQTTARATLGKPLAAAGDSGHRGVLRRVRKYERCAWPGLPCRNPNGLVSGVRSSRGA
jgi:hypothetical protein